MTTKVKLIAAGVITPSELTLTTASAGTNTVTPATTAFVQQELTSGLAPKATIASPTFTGTPAAATASGSTSTTQLATTAFVQQELTTLIGGAPSTLNDLNELAAAINDDANYNSTLTTALATKAPLASPTFTSNINVTGSSTLGSTASPLRTLDSRGSGMAIFGTGGYTEIMLRERSGTLRNTGAWHWSVRGDVGGANDDLKLLRFSGASYQGIAMQVATATGNATFSGLVTANAGLQVNGTVTSGAITSSGNLIINTAGNSLPSISLSHSNASADNFIITAGVPGTSNAGFSIRDADAAINRLVIDTSGNVGIGTTNPVAELAVGAAGRRIEIAGSDGVIRGYDRTASWAAIDFEAASYTFDAGGSLSMTLDSSGNLLVGTTNTSAGAGNSATGISLRGGADNRSFFSVNQNYVMHLNRKGNVGNILEFANDGVGVGSIGTPYAGELFIGGQGANSSGLLFTSGNTIQPRKNNAADNGNISIGTSGNSFKDLRLSGLAYANKIVAQTIFREGSDGSGLHFTTNAIIPTDQTSAITNGAEDLGHPSYRFKDLYLSGTAIAGSFATAAGGTFTTAAGNDLNIVYPASRSLFIKEGSETQITVNNEGVVGIGIVPATYLTSGYQLRLDGGSQTYLSFNNSTHTTQVVGGFVIGTDSAAARITQRQNQPIIFSTNDINRMYIEGDGDIMLHKATSNVAAAGHELLSTGRAIHTVVGSTVQILNRTSNDGAIAIFQKAGGTVVSIDTNAATFNNVVNAPIAVTHGGSVTRGGIANPPAMYLGANGSDYGTTAIYRTPTIESTSSSTTTSNFVTIYSSGHWGEYPCFRFKVYGSYYVAGYREYLGFMTGTSASLVEVQTNGTTSFFGGGGNNTITMGAAVGSGLAAHGGQARYRRDFSVTTHGNYGRCHVVVEIMFGGNRYFGSNTTTANIDADGTTGGSYHFKTMSDAQGKGTFGST